MNKNNFSKEQKEACYKLLEEAYNYLYDNISEEGDFYPEEFNDIMTCFIEDKEYKPCLSAGL